MMDKKKKLPMTRAQLLTMEILDKNPVKALQDDSKDTSSDEDIEMESDEINEQYEPLKLSKKEIEDEKENQPPRFKRGKT